MITKTGDSFHLLKNEEKTINYFGDKFSLCCVIDFSDLNVTVFDLCAKSIQFIKDQLN